MIVLTRMPVKKTALLLGYKCNNNCRFCYCGDKRDLPSMGTAEAKKQLGLAKKRGSDYVDFLGGEPTIRKDLQELVKYAGTLGFKTISITTNGRMLSNRDFAKSLLEAGLNSIVFSINGPNAEIHDYLSGVQGAFGQAIQGMKNVRSLPGKVYICTNTTITKPNIKFLPEIAELSASLGANAMEFIFPHPKGNAWTNFEEMVPMLEELIGVAPKTIEVGKKHGILHCWFRYVPLCYLYGCWDFVSETASQGKLEEQHIGPEFQDLEVEKNRALHGRVKGPQCRGCKYSNSCEGIFREYVEKRGFQELVPIP
ncbi:MAG: radical SAM protein [Candidatus Diapherotrites archaeon]